MRPRIAIASSLAVGILAAGVLSGCAQIAQVAGDAVGVPVEQTCTAFDDAYSQYQSTLDQAGATAEQVTASKDALVTSLNGFADAVGGTAGDLIRANAQQLADATDVKAPEAVQAIEQIKSAIAPICG